MSKRLEKEGKQRKSEIRKIIDWAKLLFGGLDAALGDQEKIQKNATAVNEEKNKQIDQLRANLEQVLKENKKLRQKITDGNIDMEIRVARLG